MPKALIISANFYPDITDMLLDGACDALDQQGWEYDQYTVPGVFEIPAIVRRSLNVQPYDAYLALGCVIRGETSHYDYVCTQNARGLMDIASAEGVPIGYGILTVENKQQAIARAAVGQGNKGRDAVLAALAVAVAFAQP